MTQNEALDKAPDEAVTARREAVEVLPEPASHTPAMTERFDLSRPVVGVEAIQKLVAAIVAGEVGAELDCVEWKSQLDFSSATHRFDVGRHILGFGNRAPDVARLQLGGNAYLVVGAEPSNLLGQAYIDTADLMNAIRPYVAAGTPPWTPMWVPVDGTDVLVIAVPPPKPGDRICTVDKGAGTIKAGAIYVRRHGQTEFADPAEVRMLEERFAARGDDPLCIAVELPGVLRRLDVSDQAINGWVDAWRNHLLEPVLNEIDPPEPVESHERGAADLGDAAVLQRLTEEVSRPIVRPNPGEPTVYRIPDGRTPSEYQAEIEKWAATARQRLRGAVIAAAVKAGASELRPRVRNPTTRYAPAVELRVEIDGAVFLSADDEGDELPNKPRVWGNRAKFRAPWAIRSDMLLSIEPIRIPQYDIINETHATWLPCGLRQFASADLDAVPVYATADSGEAVVARWNATSTAYDGRTDGQVEVPIDPVALGPPAFFPLPPLA